jgi:type I restriction enzyme R subunit
MEKEAKARIRINRLLQHAGWRFFDDGKGLANIALEVNAMTSPMMVREDDAPYGKRDQ